jgi:ribonucleoside-diphosphate reductase beta chain
MKDRNCKIKKLFNPEADDSNPRLYGGCTTNILNLVNVKYPQFLEYVDIAYQNNWHFAKVDMTDDRKQYENVLSNEEREAYDNVISFLIFLDSIQTNNLPNISDYITLPEIVYWLGRQTWDEALHSRSYAHILANGVPIEAIERITYKWRENKTLLERNRLIAETYQEGKDNHNDKNFISLLVANYLLEGLYFYNGFQFFHNLASRGLMIGTDTQIRYIQRDENVHCLAFQDMINISKEEDSDIWTDEIKEHVYDMFRTAVEWELKFSLETLGNKILGMTEQSITDYTYNLANRRLKDIGLDQIFPKTKNPYVHLEKIAAVDDESSNRSNQFEVTSITYKSPEILDGWEDI